MERHSPLPFSARYISERNIRISTSKSKRRSRAMYAHGAYVLKRRASRVVYD